MTKLGSGWSSVTEFTRFFGVALIGLALDITVAWFLAVWVGLPLMGAASIGFSLGLLTNYILHECWTFRRRRRALSGARFSKFALVQVATLLFRLGIIAGVSRFIDDNGKELLILCAAAALSFFLNFALSKAFVFIANAENTSANGADGEQQ